MNLLVDILFAWNIFLTLFFLFEKSRTDSVEQSIGALVRYVVAEKEGENDWR